MRYPDAIEMLMQSDAEDWHHVSAPSQEVYVFMGDVNLRLESTLEGADVQADPFVEAWAQSFPDQHATGWFYRLHYGHTLLHRFILVAVDGARALLPLPKIADNTVDAYSYKVAQIVDSGELDSYMKRVGFTVQKSSTPFWGR